MELIKNVIDKMGWESFLDSIESEEGDIPLGRTVLYDPDLTAKVFTRWSQIVDKVTCFDKEVNGTLSKQGKLLSYWRGFTFQEYGALFNQSITEEEFPFYPVFNQLRRKQGGINFEKQRHFYLSQYTYDKEDYVRLLVEENFAPFLTFFFGAIGKLSALLPIKKLKQHMLVVASSGSGKSQLLRSIFVRLQKKHQNYTLLLIDPHGDLSKAVLKGKLSYQQRDRVIYIDPFLKEGYTPTFNPFQVSDKSDWNLGHTAEGIIVALEEILSREGGRLTENMINVLEKSLYFLLKRDGSTIHTLVDFFSANSSLKEEAAAFDPIFDDFFFKPNNKTRDALHSRLSRIINNPILSNFLGGKSTFDLEHFLNSSKVVLFNLSGFGQMAQETVGKFLIASIKGYIRKREKHSNTTPVICMVDEAHSMVSGSYEVILSQLRGFGLSMILATQFIKQFGDQALHITKNTAIKIAGGSEEDVKEVLKIDKDLKLKDYEFVLSVRGRSQLVFKSPDFLIRNPKKHMASDKEVAEMEQLQLERYYKVIGDVTHQPRRPARKQDLGKKPDTTKPPFDLFIPEDSDDD